MAPAGVEEQLLEAITTRPARGARLKPQRPSLAALAAGQSSAPDPHRRHSLSRSRSPRSPSGDALTRRRGSQHSLAVEVPDVPAIPAHFLKTGQPAFIAPPLSPPAYASASPTNSLSSHQRPTTSSGERSTHTASRSPLKRRSSLNGRPKHDRIATTAIPPRPPITSLPQLRSQPQLTRNTSPSTTSPATTDVHRSTALSSLEGRTLSDVAAWEMARPGGRANNQDYFLQAADDDDMADRDELRQLHHPESRMSLAAKRRSLPVEPRADSSDRRPSTSGNIYTTRPSRLTPSKGPSDLQRHIDSYRSTPHRVSIHFGDSSSVSGLSASGAMRRYSVVPDRSPISPSRLRERLASPDLLQYGRRRPSFGSTVSNTRQRDLAPLASRMFEFQDESPTEDSEPKRTDSASNGSQTADTVWDELDDLKTRIKKLELTGKTPTTPSAVVSGELSDRPRTATTAPTTVDSSPKQERKRFMQEKTTSTPQSKQQDPVQPVTVSTLSDVHPTLHAALAKAKPLLNANVFSILEATATDALQIASMTGSAGPQGTTFSAGSIISGATASDRHTRRKADTMCRNLTDLCLALCEGKYERPNVATRHEALSSPGVITSPQSEETLTQESPSLRHAGSDIGRYVSPSRPMSRLEARRSSILGVQTSLRFEDVSPRGSVGDISAPEQDNTQLQNQPSGQPQQRVSRAPSNLRGRAQRFDEAGGDDDSTIRPPSRAMTDIGALRIRSSNTTDDRSPIPQRAPSLRESLAARRANETTVQSNRETSRLTLDSRPRRLFDQHNTHSVLEEENSPAQFYASQHHRRITSGHFSSSRRTTAELGRSPSLRQQHHAIGE